MRIGRPPLRKERTVSSRTPADRTHTVEKHPHVGPHCSCRRWYVPAGTSTGQFARCGLCLGLSRLLLFVCVLFVSRMPAALSPVSCWRDGVSSLRDIYVGRRGQSVLMQLLFFCSLVSTQTKQLPLSPTRVGFLDVCPRAPRLRNPVPPPCRGHSSGRLVSWPVCTRGQSLNPSSTMTACCSYVVCILRYTYDGASTAR